MSSNRKRNTGAAWSRGDSLTARIAAVKSWLDEQAFPFWARLGVDGDFGFVEHLTLDARPTSVHYKRLRVQARQIYCFSHAYLMGYSPGLDAAHNGWRFMTGNGWLADGGWARLLGRRGGVLDPTLDLYDQAFALLAIAWWIRASGDSEAVAWAEGTLDVIDERLAGPSGIGWFSEAGPDAAPLQNPHMHLLEALLALYEATGQARFKTGAEKVLEMFHTFFFDPGSGTLAEYYDDRWNRAGGGAGRIIEPGHHYEWVWLLHQAERVVPGSAQRADALFKFAEHFGHEPETALVYDQVLDDGSPRATSHRCWPQAEALKARLARFESQGTSGAAETIRVIDNLFHYFLAAPRAGTWIDQLDPARNPTANKIPASTFYHLVVAFSELLRLEPQLRAAGAAA